MCLRVISAYRTVSHDASCVIASMMPVGLVIREDVECFELRGTRGVRERTRVASVAVWQREWDNSSKGRWTHRLIPNISSWVGRPHGEVHFHLTQFLSGHGCFRQYLHRFGHAEVPVCPDCPGVDETAEHILFVCPRFDVERRAMLDVCGRDTSPDNLIQRMCQAVEKWNAVSTATTQIACRLQRIWRAEQQSTSMTNL